MRALALLAAASTVLLSGCPAVDAFACSADAQCQLGGEAGICIDDQCAYPDGACPSGYSFSTGHCSPTDDGSTSTGGSPTVGGPTPTTTAGPTTSLMTTADPSTGPEPTSDAESTNAPACALEASGPLTFAGEMDLVVEQLSITSRSVRALRITDSPGVIVRDVQVNFGGNAGIVIENSPNAIIERVSLVNANAPDDGAADASEIAIHIENSDGVQIRHVRVTDARSGIQVLQSDGAVIEDFVVHNCRAEDGTGNDTGGDCVLLQNSGNGEIRRFGCTNDPTGVNAHAGIFVDRSPTTTVENGLATNVFSSSGSGVRVHTQDGSGPVTVQDVDVTGGDHSCFDTVYGDDVTHVRGRCRNNSGHGWAATQVVGEVRVQEGSYYNVSQAPSCCDPDAFVEFDVMEDQFVARLPPDVAAPCSAG